MKPCPFCAEPVQDREELCPWCDSPLPPSEAPPEPPHDDVPERVQPRRSPWTGVLPLVLLICFTGALIFGLNVLTRGAPTFLSGSSAPEADEPQPAPVTPPYDGAGARRIVMAPDHPATLNALNNLPPEARLQWAAAFDAHMHNIYSDAEDTQRLCLTLQALQVTPPPSPRWADLQSGCWRWSTAFEERAQLLRDNADTQRSLDGLEERLQRARSEAEDARAERTRQTGRLRVLSGDFFVSTDPAQEVANALLFSVDGFACADSRRCILKGSPNLLASASRGERVVVHLGPGLDPLRPGEHLLLVTPAGTTTVTLVNGSTAEWASFDEADPTPLNEARRRFEEATQRLRTLERELQPEQAALKRRLKPTDTAEAAVEDAEQDLLTCAALRPAPPSVTPSPSIIAPSTTPAAAPATPPVPEIVTTSSTLLPGDRPRAKRLNTQGYQAAKRHDLPAARDLYAQATRADPSFDLAWYNLACMDARLGDADAAAQALQNARAANPEADLKARVHEDPDFAALRAQPRFARWLEHL